MEGWIQKGSICFFIQQHLVTFHFYSSKWVTLLPNVNLISIIFIFAFRHHVFGRLSVVNQRIQIMVCVYVISNLETKHKHYIFYNNDCSRKKRKHCIFHYYDQARRTVQKSKSFTEFPRWRFFLEKIQYSQQRVKRMVCNHQGQNSMDKIT